MNWLERSRSRLFVAGLFLLAFLIYQARTKDLHRQNWLDKSLVFVSAPLQHVFVWIIDGASNLWKDYIWLVGVADENKKLKERVGELETRLVQFEETDSENKRLRMLVSMSGRLRGYSTVGARVIALSTSPSSQVVRIDAGSSDGIHVGDVVLSGFGLVGRVTGVVGGYCEVQLIIDPRSAVDAADQRSRARGIIRGQGVADACLVDHLVRTAEIKIGDKMLTSGIGGVFPPGLVIGEVISVTSPMVGVFRKAYIKPSTDFSTFEEVIVVKRQDSGVPLPVQNEDIESQESR